jgi:hypothetical protein
MAHTPRRTCDLCFFFHIIPNQGIHIDSPLNNTLGNSLSIRKTLRIFYQIRYRFQACLLGQGPVVDEKNGYKKSRENVPLLRVCNNKEENIFSRVTRVGFLSFEAQPRKYESATTLTRALVLKVLAH